MTKEALSLYLKKEEDRAVRDDSMDIPETVCLSIIIYTGNAITLLDWHGFFMVE